MKKKMKFYATLTLGLLPTLALSAAAFSSEGRALAGVAPVELCPNRVTLSGKGCEPPTETPLLDLQPPNATAASDISGSFFYMCNDFFCGECPSGTRCAIKACGSIFNPCCTFQAACVTSCTVAARCTLLCTDCF